MINRMKEPFYDVTYPFWWIYLPDWFYRLWKKCMCPRGFHLLDEVMSVESHYLICDGCGIEIKIEEPKKENS